MPIFSIINLSNLEKTSTIILSRIFCRDFKTQSVPKADVTFEFTHHLGWTISMQFIQYPYHQSALINLDNELELFTHRIAMYQFFEQKSDAVGKRESPTRTMTGEMVRGPMNLRMMLTKPVNPAKISNTDDKIIAPWICKTFKCAPDILWCYACSNPPALYCNKKDAKLAAPNYMQKLHNHEVIHCRLCWIEFNWTDTSLQYIVPPLKNVHSWKK